jgi:serine/threonine-protein kinase
MNRALSADQYIDILERSRLAEPKVLAEALAEFRACHDKAEPDCVPLAQFLQEREIVTGWQNSHLREGRFRDFFLGKYKLLRLLGAGGMGAVYLAEHVLMHRKVAVKILYHGSVDRTSLERFFQEARAVSQLDHLNIVRAFHFDSSDDFLYLVMEFIDGPDLQGLVKRYGPLQYWEAAEYIRQAAVGLAHAHAAGMVHRDVKPANLLRDPRGVVKILDLGVARMTKQRGGTLTQTSNQGMLGTVDYLAPEQALNSHDVDHRADIYALGGTLYYLLSGRAPFPEGSQAQKLLAHQIQKPEPLLNLRRDAPPELTRICDRMMAKDPKDRFQSAIECAQTVQQWSRNYRESINMTGPIRPDQLAGLRPGDPPLPTNEIVMPVRQVTQGNMVIGRE